MPAVPGKHRVLHVSPPVRATPPEAEPRGPLRGAEVAPSQVSTRRRGRSPRGAGGPWPPAPHNHLPSARSPPRSSRGALRFLSWLAGVPKQGAPPLRCGVRREGGLRAGGGSKGQQDSLLRALCRLRRSHMVPNLIRGCLRALNKPRCGAQWEFQGAAGSARTT